ncbi:hypothetical protein [Thalassotalea euphylliae]|uniref:Uncharacterized protein n=1 Tax=Thalassotalea euphylliae TaxID=1655234 RepID=A0A3E0U116_9GAMM|nr:hypothetical protein [Thalassotalea euphylliae]REL29915.1 hypothetical protein DXX94_03895 [Thalassotalea euphylliae]
MESSNHQCEHEKNSKRLSLIAKVFFPSIAVFSALIYQQYRFSVDTIEVKIFSKNITWTEFCGEYQCIESPQFNIITLEEHFTTSEDIYHQIEPNNTYFLSIKGWTLFKSKRKVVKVY